MRRFLSLVLALVLALSLGLTASAAGSAFSDMPPEGYWSREALDAAVANGLMKGDNGLIRPGDPITRAEAATMINRAFGATKTADVAFADVGDSDWFKADVQKAVYMGTFQGVSADSFAPNDSITREQAFTALARALALPDGDASALNDFGDAAAVSDWAKGPLAAMVQAGYVNGSDGMLNPGAPITREEFAQVMYNIIRAYADGSSADLPAKGNVVIRDADVTLKDVTIDGDLILADGASGTVTLDNVKVTGRILVRSEDAKVDMTGNSSAAGTVVTGDNTTVTTGKDADPGKVDVQGENSKVVPAEETPAEPGSSTGGSSSGGGSSTKTYTVTFNTDKGTAPDPQKVKKGATAEKPVAPKADGYACLGWYTDEDCTAKFDFATAITADTDLYAKWVDSSVTEQGPTKDIDDIIASGAEWEKVAVKDPSVFIEGICINSQGDIWFVDVADGSICHVLPDGTVNVVYQNPVDRPDGVVGDPDTEDHPGIMPNGAKFVSDTQILLTDRSLGLALFDTTKAKADGSTPGDAFTTLIDKDPGGENFLGLNDLVVKDNGDGTVTVFFTDSGSKSYYTDTYPDKGNVYTCVVDPEMKKAAGFKLVAWGIAYPNGVTMDPTGTYLYVTEFAENQVLSVPTDMSGREGIRIFARLNGGIGPDGVECDQNGYVYCAHLEAGEVVVLDTKGYEVCRLGLPLFEDPIDGKLKGYKVDNVCIYGGYLYCCEADYGTIWRIDVTDFVSKADGVTPVTCEDAIDKTNTYPVTEQGPTAKMADVVSGDTWELVAQKDPSVFIEGICINSQDEIWFVDVADGSICHVLSDGTVNVVYQNPVDTPAGVAGDPDTEDHPGIMPNGAKFVSDTQILLTDRSLGLALFDTTKAQADGSTPGDAFTTLIDKDPDGKAFLGLNDLVVKDNGDGTVTVFFTDSGSKSYYTDTYPLKGNVYTCVVDPEAKSATGFKLVAKGIAYPNCVTVDPTGTYLYVTEFAENQVLSIPTNMEGREGIRIFARLNGGIGPDGVECDENGYVYGAHLEAGEVVVLDTKGYEVCKIGVPDGFKVDNVCINGGYLYCCEADNGAIWRIPMA